MDLYTTRQNMSKGISIYEMPLDVVFYCRVSTSTDDQIHSLDNQVSFFKDFIANKSKWNLVGYYVDEGITGTATYKRKAFLNMVEDAKKHKFDLVLTKEVSRFARNTLDSIQHTREFLESGVGVFFVNDNINTLEPDSELRLTIMASIAQDESRKISERVKFGHRSSIKQGVVLGNNKIWGYFKDKGRLKIDPEEAKMIALIFEMYAKGFGYRKIGLELKSLGYTNSNGNIFKSSTLQKIITNPKYKGFYCGNKTSKIEMLSRRVKTFSEKDWVIWKDETGEVVPAIVSEELWDRCYSIWSKKNKQGTNSANGYNSRYAYSGIIKCGNCGNTFWRQLYKYESGDKELWHCKTYHSLGSETCAPLAVYTEDLDKALESHLKSLADDRIQKHLEDIYDLFKKAQPSFSDKLEEAVEKRRALEKKKEKLLELVIENIITNSEFKARNNKLNNEIEAIESQIEELKNNSKQKENIDDQILELRRSCKAIAEGKSSFSTSIIASAVSKIVVAEDRDFNSDGKKIDLDIYYKAGFSMKKSYIKHRDGGIAIL